MKKPICVVFVSLLFASTASIVLADPVIPFPKPPHPFADSVIPFPRPSKPPYRVADSAFFAVPDFK